MASTGIGQKFPKGAIFLIISQVLNFYYQMLMLLTTDANLPLLSLLSIASYIFLAITVLARKRSTGMLIASISVAFFHLIGFQLNLQYGVFAFLGSLTGLISVLSLVVFAFANIGVSFFEGLQKVVVRIYRIAFFVSIFVNVITSMQAFGLVDNPGSVFLSLVVSIFCKIAVYKVGLWMADGSRAKPARVNAYLFDTEPYNLKSLYK